jgi:hypothetical protein
VTARTFRRTPGQIDLCATCNALEIGHLWICHRCGEPRGDGGDLPGKCRFCTRPSGATLRCPAIVILFPDPHAPRPS